MKKQLKNINKENKQEDTMDIDMLTMEQELIPKNKNMVQAKVKKTRVKTIKEENTKTTYTTFDKTVMSFLTFTNLH